MQVKKNIQVFVWAACSVCLFLVCSCVEQRAGAVQAQEGVASAQTEAAPKKPSSYYAVTVQPLSAAECARCHTYQFTALKNNGARHQGVNCTECHETFHAYNPLKNNYAAIMPKCSSCHSEPHGKDPGVQNCLACHKNPHSPLVSIPNPADMEKNCRICHSKVGESLTQYKSKHTEVECSSCHSQKHGRKPECSECHQSHSPAVQMGTKECLSCHPVHTPLNIAYSGDIANNAICAGCHNVPFEQLASNKTKHSALACAKCHPKHKQLMACQQCHGQTPHNPAIHAKYPKCGSCHDIAHNIRK